MCRLHNVVTNSALPENHSVQEQLRQSRTSITTEPVSHANKNERVTVQDDRLFEVTPLSGTGPEEEGHCSSFCHEQVRGSCEQYRHHNHHQNCHHNHCRHRHYRLSIQKPTASAAGHLKQEEDASNVIDSFHTLRVSSSNSPPSLSSAATNHPAVAIPRSCRAEATSSAMCLDDTTVDDLAGYLDEIMFLPKPMSEMAELMYT